MPTQLQAWRRAWADVGDEVRHGVLSHAGTPTRKVRQTLFNTIFADLPTVLRSPRYQASPISQTEADEIAAATRAHLGELRVLTEVSDFVRRWIATTPELARERAAANNAADLWAPRVQRMVEDAGGVAMLAAQGEAGWEAWLRRYDHLDDTAPRDLPADGRAVRMYLGQPGVAALVEEEIDDVWARRPAETRTGRPDREFLGHLPWRVPTSDARRQIDARADRLLERWPHDTLCRVFGLTRVDPDTETLPPPPVFRPQEAGEPVAALDPGDEGWESDDAGEDDERRGIEAPLDRSLLLRLVHRNRRAPIAQGRPIHVHELVSEEIARSAAPLGLLGADARRALVAAVMPMTFPLWSSEPESAMTTANHPDRDVLRIVRLVRRLFRGRDLEELPQDAQRRLLQPADTFGPRVWSRLHNRERDRREEDSYRTVASAFSSWLKDLLARYSAAPGHTTLEDLPRAPGLDGAPYVRGEEVAIALRHLAETLPDEVRAFGRDLEGGFATALEWHQLTEAVEQIYPGIIDPWPAFDAVRDYLNELRSDRP